MPAYLGLYVAFAPDVHVSTSSTATVSRPEFPSASGSHDIANYVTIFLAIHRQRLSGVLETGTRRGWRRLYFLEGEVVGASSSFKQDSLGRTLADAGIMPKERIQWVEERLGSDEHLETALLASGALTPAQLAEHDEGRIRQGIAAPLRSAAGSWRFEPAPGLDPRSIAPELRPQIAGIAALWDGIRQHLAVDKVLPEVTDADLGPLVAGEGLRDLLPAMELEPPMAFLGEAIGDGISVEELFKQIPDRSGNLLKLVWMLERGGQLQRKDRPADTNLATRLAEVDASAADPAVLERLLAFERRGPVPTEPSPTVDDEPGPTPRVTVKPAAVRVQAGPASPTSSDQDSAPPSSVDPGNIETATHRRPPRSYGPLGENGAPHISIGRFTASSARGEQSSTAAPRSTTRRAEPPMTPALIAKDHAKRMGRDFYGFLGVKPGAPSAVVDRRCKHMAQRWSSAGELDLDEGTQRQLQQLLHGLRIVWQTLTHDERKDEYDRRMTEGHAPKVEEIQRALEGGEQPEQQGAPADDEDLGPMDGADIAMARRLVARGAIAPATRLLEKLRRNEPSDPDVLAELGWAVWKLKGSSASGENSPEDYIALALTFAPSHVAALEYHARIAFERGDLDALQERLDRLLRADRANAWALEVLSSDALSTSSSRRSGGGGLRFWRRKSD
jgi:hypothetical protein